MMLKFKGKSITIFLSLVIIISVVFIIYNFISAQIEETPAFILNIPGSLKTYFQAKANCPAFATDVADNNALTIKDTCTGLVWARYELPTMKSVGDPNPGYSWDEAKAACDSLEPAHMFRLPKVEELLSIINYHCDTSNCVALAPLVRPAFSRGIYWTISDFHEPDYWANPSAEPPGVPARDYKRTVNLLSGEVDSPVFGQEVRLNALCVVDRQPEIFERKFISANTNSVPNGTQVTGGTLKTIYHRECTAATVAADCPSSMFGPGATCESTTASLSDCGNFTIESGEDCDGTTGTAATPADSSSTKQYYCTADCHLTGGFCGDNTAQFPKEECDGTSGAAATPGESSKNRQYSCTNCIFTGGWCGDDILQTAKGEQCDVSKNVATSPSTSSATIQYACTPDCQKTGGWCGDNTVQTAKGEQCDSTVSPSPSNSSVSNQYTCTNCLPTGGWCGDGTVQTAKGEQCDDGNDVNTDTCNNACQWTFFTIPSILLDNSNGAADSVSGDGVVYDDDAVTTSAEDKPNGTYLKVASVMPTPYIWIADSLKTFDATTNPNNEVSKLRTFTGKKRDCVRSGSEIDCSWLDGASNLETQGQKIGTYTVGSNPSRTAVNVETGDVWIADRGSGDIYKLDINGVQRKRCCTASFSATCDTTSGPRGIAITENGDVWIGNYGKGTVVKISGADAANPSSTSDPSCAMQEVGVGGYPYGLAIDSNGNVWVSNNNLNQSLSYIQKINASTFAVESHPAPYPYGITVDLQDNVWGGHWTGGEGHGVYEVAKNALPTSVATPYLQTHDTTGITIDLAGNIWASNYPDNKVVKIDQSTGSVIGYFDQRSSGSNPPYFYPHGIVGDSSGNVWSVQRRGDNARVFDATGAVLGDYCVRCSSSLPGIDNYTYSDMTGLNRALLLRSGIWLAKFDSNNNDQHWGALTWTQLPASLPPKQSIEVLARSSNNSDFSGATWQLATTWNSSARTGRYLQIKITVHSSDRGLTPVVSDLKIQQPN